MYRSFFGIDITDELINEFGRQYEAMYKEKGMNNKNDNEITKLCADLSLLSITVAYENDEPLVYHTYLYDSATTRLRQSCSLFRSNKKDAKIIGYANRGLHWYDMKLFKEMGCRNYDWGGIWSMENPTGIDSFKIAFGGKFVSYYNAVVPISIKGKIYLFVNRLLKRR